MHKLIVKTLVGSRVDNKTSFCRARRYSFLNIEQVLRSAQITNNYKTVYCDARRVYATKYKRQSLSLEKSKFFSLASKNKVAKI